MMEVKAGRKKAKKHQRILDAAEALLKEEGLEALSMNKLAKRAGVAKGTAASSPEISSSI